MTKRYYYDCPIEAGYMTYYHGISYENAGFEDVMQDVKQSESSMKYYVSSKSEELLIPQIGDIIKQSAHGTTYMLQKEEDRFIGTESKEKTPTYRCLGSGGFSSLYGSWEIVERSEMHFIYPKCEEME